MRAVIQRVKQASVRVEGEMVGSISQGLLVFLAIHQDDTEDKIEKMARKLVQLRIFENEEGKMSRSVQDIEGSILLVSQFTLYGDCSEGNRPSFITSARPEKAIPFYEAVIEKIRTLGITVETGRFGQMMEVALINDGPTTIILDI
ncbi:D-tyrosyl-tRNA(Tyr) deacylase [Candidatus Uhrbacteria bacterium]|nr:D-tyrosyl-tRNA(Tyr) deacylase [Candidatus Uhrbacteria bacterium]